MTPRELPDTDLKVIGHGIWYGAVRPLLAVACTAPFIWWFLGYVVMHMTFVGEVLRLVIVVLLAPYVIWQCGCFWFAYFRTRHF